MYECYSYAPLRSDCSFHFLSFFIIIIFLICIYYFRLYTFIYIWASILLYMNWCEWIWVFFSNFLNGNIYCTKMNLQWKPDGGTDFACSALSFKISSGETKVILLTVYYYILLRVLETNINRCCSDSYEFAEYAKAVSQSISTVNRILSIVFFLLTFWKEVSYSFSLIHIIFFIHIVFVAIVQFFSSFFCMWLFIVESTKLR